MRKIKAYGSKTCSLCQRMQPVLSDLAEEGLINIEFYEITGNEQMFFNLGIQIYPTLMFFDNEEKLYLKTQGKVSREKILEYYNEVL